MTVTCLSLSSSILIAAFFWTCFKRRLPNSMPRKESVKVKRETGTVKNQSWTSTTRPFLDLAPSLSHLIVDKYDNKLNGMRWVVKFQIFSAISRSSTTDRQTNQLTDRVSYRDAMAQLKRSPSLFLFLFFFLHRIYIKQGQNL